MLQCDKISIIIRDKGANCTKCKYSKYIVLNIERGLVHDRHIHIHVFGNVRVCTESIEFCVIFQLEN